MQYKHFWGGSRIWKTCLYITCTLPKHFSLCVGEEQILTILWAKENAMFSVTCAGWQELRNKYLFLSVSFLNISVNFAIYVSTGCIKK